MPLTSFEPTEGRLVPPYDEYSSLRRECPVARSPSGYVYVASYAGCSTAFRDWRSFSNAGGMRFQGVVVPSAEQFINEKDGAPHRRLRRLIQEALSPTKVAASEPFIRSIAQDLVDRVVDRGSCDLLGDFAEPLPGIVINRLLGIPLSEQAQFKQWIDELIEGPYPATHRGPNGRVGLKDGHPDLSSYIDAIVADRTARGGGEDDLLARFVRVEVDGERLTPTEIRTALVHLIIAGNRTTGHTLGNLFLRMVGDPFLYNRVRDDRSLVPVAVEESMRVDATTQLVMRTCERETVLEGVVIPGDTRLILGIGSANRDEMTFDSPDDFDLDRHLPSPHLTFGQGAHSCLGAGLARLEMVVAINTLMDSVGRMEFAPGFLPTPTSAHWAPEFWAYGLKHLMVTVNSA